MDICFSRSEDELVIELIGELDHHTAKGIGEKIDFEILISNSKNVILDFDRLEFMDSSGLAVIMGRAQTCRQLGAEFCVVGLHGAIKKVLLMSGLQKYVKIKEKNYEIY